MNRDEFSLRAAVAAGIDVIRRRPWIIGVWFLLYLVTSVIGTTSHQLSRDLAIKSISAGRNAAAIGLSMTMVTIHLVLLFGATSMILSSAFRSILSPSEAPFQLGKTEWRVVLARAAVQVIGLPFFIVTGWLAMHNPHAGLIGWSIVGISIPFELWTATAAMWAFGREEIALLGCWRLLKGQFGKVVAAFVAISVVTMGAERAVGHVAILINHHVALPAIVTPSALATPAVLFKTILGDAISALQIAAVAALIAVAYRSSAAAHEPYLGDDRSPADT